MWKLISHPLTRLILVYLVGVSIVFQQASDWTARQTWVVILTGVVVIWYTWETRKLRAVATHQIAMQIRPLVLADPRVHDNSVTVNNIGHGPALNVRMTEVELERMPSPLQAGEEWPLTLRFDGSVPILKTGDEARFAIEVYLAGERFADIYAATIDPRYTDQTVILTIKYEDIDLKHYTIRQTIAPHSMTTTSIDLKPDA